MTYSYFLPYSDTFAFPYYCFFPQFLFLPHFLFLLHLFLYPYNCTSLSTIISFCTSFHIPVFLLFSHISYFLTILILPSPPIYVHPFFAHFLSHLCTCPSTAWPRFPLLSSGSHASFRIPVSFLPAVLFSFHTSSSYILYFLFLLVPCFPTALFYNCISFMLSYPVRTFSTFLYFPPLPYKSLPHVLSFKSQIFLTLICNFFSSLLPSVPRTSISIPVLPVSSAFPVFLLLGFYCATCLPFVEHFTYVSNIFNNYLFISHAVFFSNLTIIHMHIYDINVLTPFTVPTFFLTFGYLFFLDANC